MPRSVSESRMSADTPVTWDSLLTAFRTERPDLYRSWFEGLRTSTFHGGQMVVDVDDPARARYLAEKCTEAFVQCAIALTGHLVGIRFQCLPHDGVIPPPNRGAMGLNSSPLNPDYTFEQFVVGPSNRLAHAAGRAVCNQPGALYNPLFVHGQSGLGKTHLLQAICVALQQRNAHVVYVTCETFVNEFVRAIETGELPAFRDSARRADALVIDDVQFLANRESSQEELFHTFNVLYQSRKQIILSADSPPSDIPTLEDRLVSRFNWGLVAQIDTPSRETRQAILQKKARLRGCEVPDDVLDFIAERMESNIRLLEGALTKLISETQIAGKPMNVDTARAVIDGLDGRPARPLQVNDILEVITRHFGLRLPDLIGRKRSRSVSHPRQIGMYLARKLTPLSLEEIGSHFGGRDHSTVLHAERVIDSSRRHDTRVAETLSILTRQLLTRR